MYHFEPSSSGFWGPVTSTLDWCEQNYQVSFYIAEFWNSLSNIGYVILAILGLLNAFKAGSLWSIKFSYLSLAMVGFGSFAFHSTLLFESQMSDELPMIYLSSFCLFSYLEVHGLKSTRSFLTAFLLIAYSMGTTYIYLNGKDPIFFQSAYAVLVNGLILAPIVHILWVKDDYTRSLLWKIYWVSLGAYALGFTFWKLDNDHCSSLRAFRSQATWYPVAVLTEFHLWWHFLTGIGCYGNIVMASYLQSLYVADGGKKGSKIVRIQWILGYLPVISINDGYRKKK